MWTQWWCSNRDKEIANRNDTHWPLQHRSCNQKREKYRINVWTHARTLRWMCVFSSDIIKYCAGWSALIESIEYCLPIADGFDVRDTFYSFISWKVFCFFLLLQSLRLFWLFDRLRLLKRFAEGSFRWLLSDIDHRWRTDEPNLVEHCDGRVSFTREWNWGLRGGFNWNEHTFFLLYCPIVIKLSIHFNLKIVGSALWPSHIYQLFIIQMKSTWNMNYLIFINR